MNEQVRDEQLEHLSKEIERLIDRVASDVKTHRGGSEHPTISGFVLYLLHAPDSAPVESRQLKEFGIEPNDIAETHGFSALSEFCAGMQLQARIEDSVRRTKADANPCLGIIVDGWP